MMNQLNTHWTIFVNLPLVGWVAGERFTNETQALEMYDRMAGRMDDCGIQEIKIFKTASYLIDHDVTTKSKTTT